MTRERFWLIGQIFKWVAIIGFLIVIFYIDFILFRH